MSVMMWIAVGAGAICLVLLIVAIWNYPTDNSF